MSTSNVSQFPTHEIGNWQEVVHYIRAVLEKQGLHRGSIDRVFVNMTDFLDLLKGDLIGSDARISAEVIRDRRECALKLLGERLYVEVHHRLPK